MQLHVILFVIQNNCQVYTPIVFSSAKTENVKYVFAQNYIFSDALRAHSCGRGAVPD